VLSNIARVINQDRLAGTGMFVILPVDQGFEHGPGAELRAQSPRL
jgi:fructose-bisphosphate aldolase, class I